MTDTELKHEINSILNEIEEPIKRLKELVINYADTHDKLDLYNIDGGELERRIDGLGWLNGWIIDRLNHRNQDSNLSRTRKIRKAQGYNL